MAATKVARSVSEEGWRRPATDVDAMPFLADASGYIAPKLFSPKNFQDLQSSGSLGEESTRDRQSLTAHFDNVFHKKLSASASFQHAVHFDFAVLDHELGMSPGSRNGTQFQELIQTEFSGFRISVRHRRGLLSVQGWSAGSWLSCGPNCGSTQSLICSHHSAPIILSETSWQNDGAE